MIVEKFNLNFENRKNYFHLRSYVKDNRLKLEAEIFSKLFILRLAYLYIYVYNHYLNYYKITKLQIIINLYVR